MSKMQFYSLSQLAGNNLSRTKTATVRGSTRRNDPDINSASPYFPDVAVGQTLSMRVSRIDSDVDPDVIVVEDVTATLTGNPLNKVSISQAIADINTSLVKVPGNETTRFGIAVDSDGTIQISTYVLGGAGIVEVYEGSASTGLGFNLVNGPIKSTGGDIGPAPEGRVGNTMTSAFPSRREDLTVDSFNRSLGKLAQNTDVLYSEDAKQFSMLQKVEGFTVSDDGTYITLPSSVRVFTGGPVSANSGSPLRPDVSREELSPYFLVFDTVTKQPTAGQVVGVVHGTPTSYTVNTDSWGALDGKSVLGIDLVKQEGIAVSSIYEGRTLTLKAPLSSDVVVGDFLEIYGATNTDQWDHNGYRWAIEAVHNPSTISLRPLSLSEMTQVGSNPEDTQPILSLNPDKTQQQSYGMIRVRTGLATSHATLVLNPPLSPSSSVEVWAAQAASIRGTQTWSDQAGRISSTWYADSTRPDHNCLLTHPDVSIVSVPAGTVSVGSFYARWNGRVVFIPAHTFTTSVHETSSYLYWDVDTATVKVTISPSSIFNFSEVFDPTNSLSTGKGIPICKIDYPQLTELSITPMSPVLLDPSHGEVTVGWGGNFQSLAAAISFANCLYSSNSEGITSSGSYPHFGIEVLSSQLVDAPLDVMASGITVRGSNKDVQLVLSGSSAYMFGLSGSTHFSLKNMTVGFTQGSSMTSLAKVSGSGTATVVMEDLEQDMSSTGRKAMRCVVSSHTSAYSTKVVVSRCKLVVGSGVFWGRFSDVAVHDSDISCVPLLGVTSQAMSPSPTSSSSDAGKTSSRVSATNSKFSGFWASNYTTPIFAYDNSSDSSYLFDGCHFGPMLGSTDNTGVLFNLPGPSASFSRCTVSPTATCVSVFADGGVGGGNISVDDCTIYTITQNGQTALRARSVNNTKLYSYTPSGTGAVTTGISVGTSATGNTVTGVFSTGISSAAVGAVISGNTVSLDEPSSSIDNLSLIQAAHNDVVVSSNNLTILGSSGSSVLAKTAVSGTRVDGNVISCSGGACAVDLCSPISAVVTKNRVVGGDGSVEQTAFRMPSASGCTVSDNNVTLGKGSGSNSYFLDATGSPAFDGALSGNTVVADAAFKGFVTGRAFGNSLTCADLGNFTGTFTGNTVTGKAVFFDPSEVVGNKFYPCTWSREGGVSVSSDGSETYLIFADNYVESVDTFGVALKAGGGEFPVKVTGCRIIGDVRQVGYGPLDLDDCSVMGGVQSQTPIERGWTIRIQGCAISGSVSLTSLWEAKTPVVTIVGSEIGQNVEVTLDNGNLMTVSGCQIKGNLIDNGSSSDHDISGCRVWGKTSIQNGAVTGCRLGTNPSGVGSPPDSPCILTNCTVSGCVIEASTTTAHQFLDCRVGECYVTSGSKSTVMGRGQYSSLYVYGDALLAGSNSEVHLISMSNVEVTGSLTAGFLVPLTGVQTAAPSVSMSECYIGSGLTVYHSTPGCSTQMFGTSVGGSATIYRDVSAHGCKFYGDSTLGDFHGSPYTDVTLSLSGCEFSSTSPLSVAGNLKMTGCRVGAFTVRSGAPLSILDISGTDFSDVITAYSVSEVRVSGCKLLSSAVFTGCSDGSIHSPYSLLSINNCTFGDSASLTATNFSEAKVSGSNPSSIVTTSSFANSIYLTDCVTHAYSKDTGYTTSKNCKFISSVTSTGTHVFIADGCIFSASVLQQSSGPLELAGCKVGGPITASDNPGGVTLRNTSFSSLSVNVADNNHCLIVSGCTGGDISFVQNMTNTVNYKITDSFLTGVNIPVICNGISCIKGCTIYSTDGYSPVKLFAPLGDTSADSGDVFTMTSKPSFLDVDNNTITMDGVSSSGASLLACIDVQVSYYQEHATFGSLNIRGNSLNIMATDVRRNSDLYGFWLHFATAGWTSYRTFPFGKVTFSNNSMFAPADWTVNYGGKSITSFSRLFRKEGLSGFYTMFTGSSNFAGWYDMYSNLKWDAAPQGSDSKASYNGGASIYDYTDSVVYAEFGADHHP